MPQAAKQLPLRALKWLNTCLFTRKLCTGMAAAQYFRPPYRVEDAAQCGCRTQGTGLTPPVSTQSSLSYASFITFLLSLLSALADGTCPMAMLIEIGLWLCSSELFSLQAVHSLQSASWPHFTCRQTTDFGKKLSQTHKHM